MGSNKTKRHYRAGDDLFDPVRWALFGVVGVLLTAAAGWAGYEFGLRDAGEQKQRFLAELDILFDGERRWLEQEKTATAEHLNAIARKVGEMQAQLLRLEALGERLADTGGLDKEEFDFSVLPAQGGPASKDDLSASLPEMVADLRNLTERIADRETKLGLLEDLLLSRTVEADARPSGRPVASGWISSRYGWRTDPITGKKNLHKGIDYAGRHGSDIIAVADGVVTWAGVRGGYGKTVEIRHGHGFLTRYAHNSKLLVKKGDLVEQGQVIAAMGNSGRTTGTHLHFEVLRYGRAMDPMKFAKKTRDAQGKHEG